MRKGGDTVWYPHPFVFSQAGGGDAPEAGCTSARLLCAHASQVLLGFEVLQDLRLSQKNNDGNVQDNINCGPAYKQHKEDIRISIVVCACYPNHF